jgi:class 3 adenylate cyclase
MTAFRQPDADRSIAMATSQRRLSAILHADVTGFVRMMEGDEDLTVRHLKSAQTEVWRPAIEVAGGALVDNAGDSLLAEFDSALAAVAAAIDIQEHMAGFNAALDEERRLMLRIGVHLGEVIADEESGHIFGDGVNLAARIQGLAEPGGIAVSRAVRDVIEPQEAYALVDGGEHRAKNVSRRLHIYHVRVRDGAATRATAAVVPQTTLRFHGADLSGREFGFELAFDRLAKSREGFFIGRDADQCEAVLSHPTVSRRHARLVIAANTLQIEDLGSTNGTSVDGAVVIAGVLRPLQAGARLRIGDIELSVGYG